MPNIESDMDELFRKAVDQYPLKPCESQWDAILPQLSYDSDEYAGGVKNSIKNTIPLAERILLVIFSFSILTTFIEHKDLRNPSNSKEGFDHIHEFLLPEKLKQNSFSGHSKHSVYPNIHVNPGLKKQTYHVQYILKTEKNVYSAISYSEKGSADSESQGIKNLNTVSDKTRTAIVLKDLNNLVPLELMFNNKSSGNSLIHKIQASHNRGLYLGIATGPAWSLVEHGEITKPGFNLGMILGYKLNKYLSVETGLFHTTHYYFIDGKYYNQNTNGEKVRIVEASRNAFGIPINLRYNIIENPTGNLFISTGFTTYIGVNESIQVHLGDTTSRASQILNYGRANYLPSYVNFSLGYDYKMRKFFMFRIEPYLEFPLSMVAGNTMNINGGKALQVYNIGLHLAVTRLAH
jgi:hypothetical protein